MPARPISDIRIGHGYDLHRLEAPPPAGRGRPLRIGSVAIASEVGPVSHSDGDALLHAITDALLGAIGAPDIGQLFPDDDPANESGDSRAFLRAAVELVDGEGWRLANLDATVLLERPRLGPHKPAVREALAALLSPLGEPGPERVNIKGKSGEGVDAVGEGLAIACHAVVSLVK